MLNKLVNRKVSFYVNSMIKALEKPIIKVEMDSFMGIHGNVCIGCAATNTILRMEGIKDVEDRMLKASKAYRPYNVIAAGTPDEFIIFQSEQRSAVLNFNTAVRVVEDAIDSLRRGHIHSFAHYIDQVKTLTHEELTIIEAFGKELPKLTTENYKENLEPYKRFYRYLKLHKL